MMDLPKLEQRLLQLTQAAEQHLANYNATAGAKQEITLIIDSIKKDAQVVEQIADVIEPTN